MRCSTSVYWVWRFLLNPTVARWESTCRLSRTADKHSDTAHKGGKLSFITTHGANPTSRFFQDGNGNGEKEDPEESISAWGRQPSLACVRERAKSSHAAGSVT